MSFREKINQNPAIAGIVVLAVIAVAVYVMWGQASSGTSIPTEAYYTSDDGKTYFGGKLSLVPPFTQEGKEAVKAYVFECDGKNFVGYLSKMKPEAKAAVEAYHADVAQKPTEAPASLMPAQAAQINGWLFKKPGNSKWVPGGPGFRFPINCENGKVATAVE